MNDAIKDAIKEALLDTLKNYKGTVTEFLKDTVFPAADEALSEFQAEQKAEADASNSAWVKMRNALINSAAGLVWSLVKNVVTKIFENADKAEA